MVYIVIAEMYALFSAVDVKETVSILEENGISKCNPKKQEPSKDNPKGRPSFSSYFDRKKVLLNCHLQYCNLSQMCRERVGVLFFTSKLPLCPHENRSSGREILFGLAGLTLTKLS